MKVSLNSRVAFVFCTIFIFLFYSALINELYAQTKEPQNHNPFAVYIPTPPKVVDKMIELAEITKDDLLYDLGCGDARILIAAVKKYGCQGVGFDIDPEWVKKARENVKQHELEHLIRIEQKDIYTLDMSVPSVIMMYLTPSVNQKLIPQLEKAKPGTRIVSHDYGMEGVKPDQVVEVIVEQNETHDPAYKNYGLHKVYYWKAPLRKTSLPNN